MGKNYIVVGNDGLPRFADPECETVYVVQDFTDAVHMAKDMAKHSPLVVFGVYQLVANTFFDGTAVRVVKSADES